MWSIWYVNVLIGKMKQLIAAKHTTINDWKFQYDVCTKEFLTNYQWTDHKNDMAHCFKSHFNLGTSNFSQSWRFALYRNQKLYHHEFEEYCTDKKFIDWKPKKVPPRCVLLANICKMCKYLKFYAIEMSWLWHCLWFKLYNKIKLRMTYFTCSCCGYKSSNYEQYLFRLEIEKSYILNTNFTWRFLPELCG